MQAATIHSCTCPQQIRVNNKRAGLVSIWQTAAWKKEAAAYRQRTFPLCSRCGRIAHIVPGHSGEDYAPHEMKRYIDKVRKDQVVALCQKCNKEESRGRHPCPDCITHHSEDPDWYIRYIGQGEERCWSCEHGGDGCVPVGKRHGLRIRKVPAHPCRSHLMTGRCLRSPTYSQCPHAAKNAFRDCEKARPRGGVPA